MCSLSEVIAAAWDSIAPSNDTNGIELLTDVPVGLECRMERARMERVFSNLFENAIEAMRSHGKISVRSTIEGGSIVIRVEDTGPGISPSVRRRLFQPFVTAGKKNGLGLGLALSRQTLLDHGGEMWIDGDGPGARFYLRLPLDGFETSYESSAAATERNSAASLDARNA